MISRWIRAGASPYIDVIKFDFRLTSHTDMANYLNSHRHSHLTYLAEKVETQQEFNQARKMGFTLFQGYFPVAPRSCSAKPLREPDDGDAAAQGGQFAEPDVNVWKSC